MMEVIIASLIGVTVGALLQFVFNLIVAQRARYTELKSQAYADCINSVTDAGFASSDTEKQAARKKFTAFKGTLCVFGDSGVIEKAELFEQTSKKLSEPDAKSAFINLVQEIRQQGIGIGKISNASIEKLLFS